MKNVKKSIASKKGAAVTAAKKVFAGDCRQRIKRPRKPKL